MSRAPQPPASAAPAPTPTRPISRSPILERMTFAALFIGLVAGASYALGAALVLRLVHPALGAWLDLHQFYLMEGGATAFGLIVGIRVGRRLAADTVVAGQTTNIALMLAAVALAPLIHLCARAARLGWAGRGGVVASWLTGREGYDNGARLFKLLITAIYFLKTAGIAAIVGLAVVGLAVAAASTHDASAAGSSSRGA